MKGGNIGPNNGMILCVVIHDHVNQAIHKVSSKISQYYCDNTNIMYDDYWCADAQCVIKSTDLFEECDNGLFCDGQETCDAAECVPGTQIDCSNNNINGIETCNYCDSNPLTWDYRAEFTSTFRRQKTKKV